MGELWGYPGGLLGVILGVQMSSLGPPQRWPKGSLEAPRPKMLICSRNFKGNRHLLEGCGNVGKGGLQRRLPGTPPGDPQNTPRSAPGSSGSRQIAFQKPCRLSELSSGGRPGSSGSRQIAISSSQEPPRSAPGEALSSDPPDTPPEPSKKALEAPRSKMSIS